MLNCCGNPNIWPMIPISQAEELELRDLFEDKPQDSDIPDSVTRKQMDDI